MARAQRKYAESLRAKIELEKSLECSNSKRMGTEKSHVTSVYSANSNDHTKVNTYISASQKKIMLTLKKLML